MSSIQPIVCPKCGGPSLTEITWNRRKCNHCGAESMLSDDRTRLELVGWQCPKCGFNNERSVTFCGKCGASLAKVCPKCLSEMRLDLKFCNRCGIDYDERIVLYESLQQALDRGQKPEHGVQYLEAVLKLNPDDNDALCLRGQVYLNESKWRQAIGDWGKVYRSTPDYPTIHRRLKEFVDHNYDLLKRPGLVDVRLGDERARRYLKAIRSVTPTPPPPLGKTSMNLLRQMWPTKVQRMEQMYEAQLKEFEIKRDEIERAQSEAAEDLLTLAYMCVEALEENAERQRIAAERQRIAAEQARQEQVRKQAQREAREAARRAKAEKRTQSEQSSLPTPPPGVQVVYVRSEKKPKKKSCCCLPVLAALALVPIGVVGLLVWIL